MTVDELAQEIRRVDGNHRLGAGALAEALMPFIQSYNSERERLFKEALEVIARDNYTEAFKGGNDIWSHVLALAVEKLKESEKQVEKLKADLELSWTREHGLRANLDVISSKVHEIERAIKRGSIHPDEFN